MTTTFRDKVITAVTNLIFSPELGNAMQTRAMHAASWPATSAGEGKHDNAPPDTADATGSDGLKTGPGTINRYGITDTSGIPAAKLMVLDDTIDWRDRDIVLDISVYAAAASLPGGANDYRSPNDAVGLYLSAAGNTPACHQFYSGSGSGKAGTPGTNPSNGNAPEAAFAGTNSSYVCRVLAASTDLMLYVEKNTPFRICLYNQGGGAYFFRYRLSATSAKLGKR